MLLAKKAQEKKNMEKIGFCLMQLIVESKIGPERFINPTKTLFDGLDKTSLITDDVYYEVECENCDDYLWLYYNYGKASPRNDTIINISTGKKKNNSRKNDEAELLDQLFVLYSYRKQILYISNSKKKKAVEQFLKQSTKQEILIKSFYKNPTEIMSILKNVDKIKFTHVNNLFSQGSKERQALLDLTGTDAPESFTIEASYNSHKITSFLQSLFRGQDESRISDLVICGRDESDFSFVYNVDSFSRRVDIICMRDEGSGLFNPESLKKELLKTIKDEA